ncbi:hypothetical protein SAMN06265171_110132 [Chryseobacterium rhizoplanae]|uniref:Uncharacterized protein n=1 Tax=Chryseobacterium rhizoplanae TaxID=1609531 RepID=A0A521EYH0_9FLAO|nr:hypothetical protein SAMN06265171_110132 [Chryseobacterium rhizoplanae]
MVEQIIKYSKHSVFFLLFIFTINCSTYKQLEGNIVRTGILSKNDTVIVQSTMKFDTSHLLCGQDVHEILNNQSYFGNINDGKTIKNKKLNRMLKGLPITVLWSEPYNPVYYFMQNNIISFSQTKSQRLLREKELLQIRYSAYSRKKMRIYVMQTNWNEKIRKKREYFFSGEKIDSVKTYEFILK